jgi:hypothetical protein
MPPAWLRRPVTVVVWLLVSVLCLVLSPLILLTGTLAARLTRRSQPAILAHLIVAYFSRELAALLACGGLWLGSDAPIGRTFHTRMWLVRRGEIPADPERQVAWLNDWWARIDRWIDEHRTEPRFD